MRHPIAPAGVFATVFLLIAATAPAATLKVGPNRQFAVPSQAIRAARDGDTIEIDAGTYPGDVATIRANGLTIRGVGNGRAKLPANGKDAGGKGIWVVVGNDLTVENIEFSGARVRDRNGAGMRAEGKNLTVRNCRFYDCENGVLGGNGEMLFEHCEFQHCGPVANPATHSLYIGQRCTRLIFRYNYSTDVIEGHLLKSRAQESWILYNRITDESGTGSAVADFPNGGVVVVIGNLLHKGARGHNSRVIAYGMEGVKHERNALCVVNNTMVYEHRHTGAFFVRVEKSPETLVPIIHNNLCIGKVPLTNWPKVDAGGNLLFKTVAEAGLVDPVNYDYRLKAGSPCIGKGVAAGKFGDFDLTPTEQYVHPCKSEPRPATGPLDVGAYQSGVVDKPTSKPGKLADLLLTATPQAAEFVAGPTAGSDLRAERDWPQLQRDAARSGQSDISVGPRVKAKWIWVDEDHITRDFESFNYEAWAARTPASKLAGYVDVPDALVGDCTYLQNLVTAIEAYGSESWSE